MHSSYAILDVQSKNELRITLHYIDEGRTPQMWTRAIAQPIARRHLRLKYKGPAIAESEVPYVRRYRIAIFIDIMK